MLTEVLNPFYSFIDLEGMSKEHVMLVAAIRDHLLIEVQRNIDREYSDA